MAMTRIYVVDDPADADALATEFADDSYKIVRVNQTDKVALKLQAEQTIYWRSGASADWYIVIATQDDVTGP